MKHGLFMHGVLRVVLSLLLLSGCGRLDNNYNADGEAKLQTELVVSFPEASRCFDMLEQGLLTSNEFLDCIETMTEGKFTVTVEGELLKVDEAVDIADNFEDAVKEAAPDEPIDAPL